MIATAPSPGHHGHVRLLPGGLRQAWAGTAEFGFTGRITSDILRRYHAPAFENIPRSETALRRHRRTPGARGSTSMTGSPSSPVAPAMAGAIGVPITTTPITRDTTGVAPDPALNDPQKPITEEQQPRVRRENLCTRRHGGTSGYE